MYHEGILERHSTKDKRKIGIYILSTDHLFPIWDKDLKNSLSIFGASSRLESDASPAEDRRSCPAKRAKQEIIFRPIRKTLGRSDPKMPLTSVQTLEIVLRSQMVLARKDMRSGGTPSEQVHQSWRSRRNSPSYQITGSPDLTCEYVAHAYPSLCLILPKTTEFMVTNGKHTTTTTGDDWHSQQRFATSLCLVSQQGGMLCSWQ